MNNLERHYPGRIAEEFHGGNMAVDPTTKEIMSCDGCPAYDHCRRSRSVTCWGSFYEWLTIDDTAR